MLIKTSSFLFIKPSTNKIHWSSKLSLSRVSSLLTMHRFQMNSFTNPTQNNASFFVNTSTQSMNLSVQYVQHNGMTLQRDYYHHLLETIRQYVIEYEFDFSSFCLGLELMSLFYHKSRYQNSNLVSRSRSLLCIPFGGGSV